MSVEVAPHIPVMLNEIVAALDMRDGEVCVDGTFGAGGYTRAILESANCRVIAIDRDVDAIARANVIANDYGDRFSFQRGSFSAVENLARAAGCPVVDGFVLDLGVSSMQIDEADRGFSFRFDGPLDMRMDRENGVTAADIVNQYREEDLANLIYEYGEERLSRRIARAIVAARAIEPITRTAQLADIVRKVVPRSPKDKIDPATRTFQALRIAVNGELDELRAALVAAERILRAGGRLVIVTFHSLEDSIVKKFLQERSGKSSAPSRYIPVVHQMATPPTFSLTSSKPLPASSAESAVNPRSRSAKLRLAIRTDAPSWPEGGRA